VAHVTLLQPRPPCPSPNFVATMRTLLLGCMHAHRCRGFPCFS